MTASKRDKQTIAVLPEYLDGDAANDEARHLRRCLAEVKELPAAKRRGQLGGIKRDAMRHLMDLGVPSQSYLLMEELHGLGSTGEQTEYCKDRTDEVRQHAAIFEATQPRDEGFGQPSEASLWSISKYVCKAFGREGGDYRRSIRRFRGTRGYWQMVEGYRENHRYLEMMAMKGAAWQAWRR